MGENQNSTGDDGGLKGYLTRHMLIGIALVVVVIIALKIILGFLEPSDQMLTDASGVAGHDRVGVEAVLPQDSHRTSDELTLTVGHEVKALEGSDALLSRNTGPAVQAKPVHGSDTTQAHGAPEMKLPAASDGVSKLIRTDYNWGDTLFLPKPLFHISYPTASGWGIRKGNKGHPYSDGNFPVCSSASNHNRRTSSGAENSPGARTST